MTIYATIWGVLALILVTLFVYRKFKTRDEDDSVHVGEGSFEVVEHQQSLARAVSVIDRWGVILTIITVIYGLALAGFYFYNIWQQAQKITY